jgi:hypothetical protein
MGGACSSDGEGIDVYRVLVGNPEGKRPLGRHWRRWENNIKIDLQEVGCGGMDWIEGKRPMGRPTRRWQDIKMDLQEAGCGGMD